MLSLGDECGLPPWSGSEASRHVSHGPNLPETLSGHLCLASIHTHGQASRTHSPQLTTWAGRGSAARRQWGIRKEGPRSRPSQQGECLERQVGRLRLGRGVRAADTRRGAGTSHRGAGAGIPPVSPQATRCPQPPCSFPSPLPPPSMPWWCSTILPACLPGQGSLTPRHHALSPILRAFRPCWQLCGAQVHTPNGPGPSPPLTSMPPSPPG